MRPRNTSPGAASGRENRLAGAASPCLLQHARDPVDEAWRVPHFEKMLCDQAGLSTVYLEAYPAAGRERFAATAREIFSYVLRDLRAP